MTTDFDRNSGATAYDAGPAASNFDRQEPSLGQVVGDIADDLQRLFRQEVELAKAEVREEGAKAAKAGGMFAGSAIAALLTAVMLSLALMFALDALMPIGWAALIVGVLWAIAAAVLLSTGRSRMRAVRPLPQTTETIKENAQWPPKPNV
jgi:uncharacterized membrane protein YqjE